ncbi:Uncharacterised protein [Escherichia coli]|uniref:Uncharacterized protein n=1 Tax=Escherichia coli TaxID=562 RepID=A0A377CC54_ECOLX|nr:Uncharacterised protein [Escherichia coli]
MNNPFFKNMLVYRLSRDFTINQEELEQQLETISLHSMR